MGSADAATIQQLKLKNAVPSIFANQEAILQHQSQPEGDRTAFAAIFSNEHSRLNEMPLHWIPEFGSHI